MLLMGHRIGFNGIVSFRSWRIFSDMYDRSLRATAHNDVSKAPLSSQPRSGLHFISRVTELPATLPFQPSTHPKDTSVLLCRLTSFCPNSQWNTFNLSKSIQPKHSRKVVNIFPWCHHHNQGCSQAFWGPWPDVMLGPIIVTRRIDLLKHFNDTCRFARLFWTLL